MTTDFYPESAAGTDAGGPDWMTLVENLLRKLPESQPDKLPAFVSMEDYLRNTPPLPEPLIEGILRRGHKMLISGDSKAGKSFLLMELCIAIAEGRSWLGFPCRKGSVVYVNLEIDPASAAHRFLEIYEALGIRPQHPGDILIWNLRGRSLPLDKLVPGLIRRVRERPPDAVIFDPIYKVITGDENSAADMGAFCNHFDRICEETGCAVIFCHHHSKGVQGLKRTIDRASGSGVFARDPDAQLDIIRLEPEAGLREGATAWRMESSLREFPNIAPVNFWFEHPLHIPDDTGELAEAPAEGDVRRGARTASAGERRDAVIAAFGALEHGGEPVTVKALAEYSGVSERCIRDRLKDAEEDFTVIRGMVLRKKRPPRGVFPGGIS